jgi:2Fe-2S ferredoxin
MARVTYIEPDGNPVAVEVAEGLSLMQGAVSEGVAGIEAQCGGMCSCATCHCYVDEAWLARLPPPSPDEEQMLANVAAERRPNSRLSCQINSDASLDGIVVRFPDRQS